MTWRTHLVGGVASLALLGAAPAMLSTETLGPAVLAAALGSLLPDLDAADSRIKRLDVGGIAPFALPALVLHRAFGHRGALHSLLGLLAAGLLVALPLGSVLGAAPAWALLLGYASHLVLDACTRSGVPLLWPRRNRFHLLPNPLRIVTGSPTEDLVFVLLAALVLGLYTRLVFSFLLWNPAVGEVPL